jgi:uncharacterized protein (TIGR03435 family)
MKRQEKNVEEFVLRHIGLYQAPQEEIDLAETRIQERLRSTPILDGTAEDLGSAGNGWKLARFASAAVLVVAVAIGVYAAQRSGLIPAILPIQQESAPQVAPASQRQTVSVNSSPTPEPVAIEAVVGGPSEPVVTRLGRESLRTVAEEIAFLQSTDTGARRSEFAAASVRKAPPVGPGDYPDRVRCRGVDGELFPWPSNSDLNPTPPPQGRCQGNKVSADNLILNAYASRPLRFGGPQGDLTVRVVWSGTPPQSYYQVQATAADPSRATKAELQQMLQTLLTNRFKARVRREIREVDGYVLAVAKSDIKFKVTEGPETPGRMQPAPGTTRAALRESGGLMRFIFQGNIKMATLLSLIQTDLGGVPVADKTGLPGLYDITLNLTEVVLPAAAVPPRGSSTGGPRPIEFDPPLPKALEEQLGLTLQPGKVSVEFIIVEHIEEPSEN